MHSIREICVNLRKPQKADNSDWLKVKASELSL